MELEFILDLIEKSGYLGLFLWLWLGVFGAPIPNEVIIMTVGLAASEEVLNPVITYFVTFFGMMAALTTCFLIGKYIGGPLLPFFQKRKRLSRTIDKSIKFMNKYHAHSLMISYFFPGLRNFVPFLYGVSKLPFKTFALFAYSGAFIWLTIMFSLGFWFGDHRDTIVKYETELFVVAGISLLVVVLFKLMRRKRRQKLKSTQ
ncbi:DedA family protein [Bacillus dakarensis]|uniref:DedA family protein n=1 Tax=Robertmurraya dakarensis TaxID=1926278 RepID=UPI000981FF99|nr:DedA family protein [Bacillus dakarensis]